MVCRGLSHRDHKRIETADRSLWWNNDEALGVIVDLNALCLKFADQRWLRLDPIPITATPIADHHAGPSLHRFALVHSGLITETKYLIANKTLMRAHRSFSVSAIRSQPDDRKQYCTREAAGNAENL